MSHVSFAANLGLHRSHCNGCKCETLHKGPVCVHCKSLATSAPRSKDFDWDASISRQATLQTARARGIKAAARA